jgi:hypothetical protein
MNPHGKDDKFAIYVPEDEEQTRMPDRLELVDPPAGGKPKSRLQGGAYDPYQKQDAPRPGDTARIRRPRVDLRQLSEWIKTTQRVKSLREEDLAELEKASREEKSRK